MTSQLLLWAYPAIAAVTFGLLLVLDAPYGRHARAGWGPTMPARWAWCIMESPAVLLSAAVFVALAPNSTVAWAVFGLWQLHYVQRTFVYPSLMTTQTPWPVSLAALALVFNVYNAVVNHQWLAAAEYPADWMWGAPWWIGVIVFCVGMCINLHSDHVLRRLKAQGKGYQIPRGGLYRWVSSPNYFGEMLEWFGLALAAMSPPLLFFALFTVANLAPRALANHRWYQQRFADYPPRRKALIPFVV